LLLAGCNSTRWVPEGQRLLVSNTITLEKSGIDQDELQGILKQKPNKRLLGRPLYLDLYNLRDPRKVARKRAMKDSLCVLENEQRVLKGRRPRTCERSLKGRNGEPPVILDTALTARSTAQIELYAIKEGYFKATARDSAHYTRRRIPPFSGWRKKPFRKPKVAMEYIVEPGRPWVICEVDMRVDDPRIARYLRQEEANRLLRPNDRFDADVLDAERTRVTDHLRHLGYLYFTRDMVLFDADTSVGDHQVDVVMRIERPTNVGKRGLLGTPEGRVYHLENVLVDVRSSAVRRAGTVPDTARYDGFTVLYKGKRPPFHPKTLTGQILLKPSARFNQVDADRTFRRLTNMRVFDRVDLTYDTTGTSAPDLVNGRISLLPAKRQGFSVEVLGTNRGGSLGTSLNLSYRHKNLFRRMAALQASFAFGFEAQQTLSQSVNSSDGASTSIGNNALFNTVEIGPELSLRFPSRFGSAKSGGSRWVFTTLYNYQRRPDYTRTLAKGSTGLEVNSSLTTSWSIWADINVIRIPVRSQNFVNFLNGSNDAVLKDSYTDHLIMTFPRGVLTWNTQGSRPKRHVFFDRVTVELAGTVLRLLQEAAGTQLYTDSTYQSYYKVFNVRYADHVRLDNDFRYFLRFHEKGSMAFRFAGGFGIPLVNQTALPFESSFFIGGANGMRAWRARSLGPGSYSEPTSNFDRIGEMRLEGNVEYRFKIFGYLEGALFTDVGNIWYLQDNPAKPGGQFKADRFLSEIAVGTGLGARLNFDFFILRFDMGLQTKDPSLPAGQRWLFQAKDPGTDTRFGQKLNLNLGIGYPF
jgi:hypothetical protein